jgi:hypothetical protein
MPEIVCRKAWWQQQQGGIWAVPAGACACLGFGCPGTIACARETIAAEPAGSEPPLPAEVGRP